ncbi:integrase core domain-containing protein [Nocardia sp. NPDC006044]|uniref:integrase core domain-containing protein n=1 Tax=Nocardia sp. NPDC006044 TaxID=3364306 RepID=UPI003678C6A6
MGPPGRDERVRGGAEHLYRGVIADGDALDMEVHRFRVIYNTLRPHQALGDRTPKEFYLRG